MRKILFAGERKWEVLFENYYSLIERKGDISRETISLPRERIGDVSRETSPAYSSYNGFFLGVPAFLG